MKPGPAEQWAADSFYQRRQNVHRMTNEAVQCRQENMKHHGEGAVWELCMCFCAGGGSHAKSKLLKKEKEKKNQICGFSGAWKQHPETLLFSCSVTWNSNKPVSKMKPVQRETDRQTDRHTHTHAYPKGASKLKQNYTLLTINTNPDMHQTGVRVQQLLTCPGNILWHEESTDVTFINRQRKQVFNGQGVRETAIDMQKTLSHSLWRSLIIFFLFFKQNWSL